VKKTAIAMMLSGLLLSACDDLKSEDNAPANPPFPFKKIIPTASFTQDNDITERGKFYLQGSAANDSDGAVFTYNWTIELGRYNAGNISLSQNDPRATLTAGELTEDVTATITLRVTDHDNSTDQISKTIIIRELDVALLPPMPANPRSGLSGTDSDGDGVRDDLEIAIYNLYPLSKDNREVLRNTAVVFQNVLIAGDSLDSLDDGEVSEKIAKLAACYNLHTELNGLQEAAKIRALTFDTKERLAAYEKFKVGRNGTAQRTMEATFDECRLPQL
jgi:hypothetical protein